MSEMRQDLQSWCDLWGVGHLAPEISVEISSRMTRSLGRCYPDRKLIRIASFVREDSEELFEEVLCHEAAHVAAFHLYGRSIRPHGREWQSLMEKTGYSTSAKYRGAALSNLPPRVPRRRSSRSPLAKLRQDLLLKVRALAFKKRST